MIPKSERENMLFYYISLKISVLKRKSQRENDKFKEDICNIHLGGELISLDDLT